MNPWIFTESNSVCLSIIYFILLHPSLYHSEATPSILPLLQHDKTIPRPCWDDYLEHSLPSSFRLHLCWTPFPWERPFKRRCWMTLWGEANKFPFASDKTSTQTTETTLSKPSLIHQWVYRSLGDFRATAWFSERPVFYAWTLPKLQVAPLESFLSPNNSLERSLMVF